MVMVKTDDGDGQNDADAMKSITAFDLPLIYILS
jgi:hypothetical protein